jgi:hypothetical protein
MKSVSLFLLFPFTLFLLLFTSCASKGPKTYDPRQVAFQAEYNPLYDGQLYPSLILGLNQSVNSELRTPNSEFFNIELTSPTDNAVLRVVIDSSALNYVTIIQEILPRRGETYRFQPSVKWKYDILRALRTPGAVDLTFTCYINDEEVDIKNLHLAYRSVSECPLSLVSQGRTSDFRWLFAAYVNEDHPQIEQILTDIMQQGTVTRLTGYQTGGAQAVRNQVFAVWYYALDHGITYSSITCTSNPSPRANVQHIRFLDEVLASRQANCVDACVFFASILRKLGLKPVIFVEPCHAYLGYYTDRNRKQLALLETTITSWVNFPDLERSLDADGRLPDAQWQKVKKYLGEKEIEQYEQGSLSFEQIKLAVARSLFDKASEYDRETYEANREHFADTASITYQQLDIELLRRQVQPIK